MAPTASPTCPSHTKRPVLWTSPVPASPWYQVIAIAVAVAFLLSFGWMLVLRIFANSIIWLSLTAAFAALSFLTLLACMRANWANLGSLEADIPQAAKDLDFVEQGSQVGGLH